MPLLAVALLMFLALPQAAAPASAMPKGFQIMAQLESELSSRKAKVGDTLKLTCVYEIASQTGIVFLPAGARLTATVVAVQKRNGAQPGQLALHLTAADWKGGHADLDAILASVDSLPARPVPDADLLQDRGVSPAVGGGATMPTIDSDQTMPAYGSPSRPPSGSVTNPGTGGNVHVRGASEGEKGLGDIDKKSGDRANASVPANWEITKLDDAVAGTAITATGGDVNLPKGARLIFKTR